MDPDSNAFMADFFLLCVKCSGAFFVTRFFLLKEKQLLKWSTLIGLIMDVILLVLFCWIIPPSGEITKTICFFVAGFPIICNSIIYLVNFIRWVINGIREVIDIMRS